MDDKMQLYVMYDKVAERRSNIFEVSTLGVMVRIVKEHKQKHPEMALNEYKLVYLGEIDNYGQVVLCEENPDIDIEKMVGEI